MIFVRTEKVAILNLNFEYVIVVGLLELATCRTVSPILECWWFLASLDTHNENVPRIAWFLRVLIAASINGVANLY